MACVLLDERANCDTIASENLRGLQDLCSINKLLNEAFELEEFVRRVVDFDKHQGLIKIFEC